MFICPCLGAVIRLSESDRKEVLLEIKNDRIAAIRGGMEKEFAGGDFLDFSDYTPCPDWSIVMFIRPCLGAVILPSESGQLMPGSPATFLAVRAEPERLLETLGSPDRVYLKGSPISARRTF